MFNLKFALSHFIHQRRAIGRHGLHSPFVYRLVDEVIYDFSNKKVYTDIEKSIPGAKKLNNTDKLLYRLAAHAGASAVWLLGKHRQADKLILQQAAPVISSKKIDVAADWKDNTPPGVIFIDLKHNPLQAIDYFNRILPKVTADTMMIVSNLPENALTKTTWNIMAAHAKVTASVNLFRTGLLFFRPGQVKEDFRIRF